jgi:cyanophycin synthetase
VVGLDIAGIDLVAEDISRPLQAQGGAIVEVNAGPGLLIHLRPAEGAPQPVGRAIVDHLFPDPEDNGRIPIVGVAGSRHTTQIARLVAWILQLGGRQVGLACRDGLYLDRRQVEAGDCTHWDAGRRLLINRSVEAAVFENDAASILNDGLAYDRCAVGVVTDFGGIDKLAEHDVHDTDQMRKVLRTQIDVVLSDGVGVLNADDAQVADLASLCDGSVIYYALDEAAPAVAAHRASGGRAVLQRGPDCVLAEGPAETLLSRLRPLAAQGEALPPAALLPAVAAAWALGIVPDLITAAVQTFGTAPARTPAARAHALIDDRKSDD